MAKRKVKKKRWLKKRKYKKRSNIGLKLKKQTVYTVGAIWLWLIAGIITIAFFAEGNILTALREQLIGQVGWGMYTLPPFLVSLSFLFFQIKSSIAKPFVPAGIGIILLSLLTLTQAGMIGDFMWVKLTDALSVEGAVLLSIGALVIGFIVLFNTSLDKFIVIFVHLIHKSFEFISRILSRMFASSPNDDEDGKLRDLMIKDHKDKENDIKEPLPIPALSKKVEQHKKHDAGDDSFEKSIVKPPKDMTMWQYPPLSMLDDAPNKKADRGDMRKNADIIERTLESFGVKSKVVEVNTGPAVTQYAFEIALGTKLSKITSLSSDLALALAAPTGQVRIEAPIPGKKLVGVEIPNRGLEFVTLKRMLRSNPMRKEKSKLAVALGLDVSGAPIIADISGMPHVLIAGSTGSGKSVMINTFITSLLFRTTPSELRMIMVDPKRVELTVYNGIPHLLSPVIVEPDKILSALRYALQEMESRYKQFAEVGVRNISGFNELSGFQAMPYIVILIDELADLMAYAQAEVEDAICRLAQMARATGIHLVLATQRPSVDVITGLIKANVPTRIAFNVSSMIDSRVVLDMPGAEKLLGKGDMLFIPPNQSKPRRIQGTFVSDKEVKKVVSFLKEKNQPVEYTAEVVNQPDATIKKGMKSDGSMGTDAKFEEAIRLIVQHDKASASLLQRRLSVGYARAARILDQLEEAGLVGPSEGSKPREVLMKNIEEYYAQNATQQDTSE
ncbi:DNA translocase FtsK [Patescibacteria group bacterium]